MTTRKKSRLNDDETLETNENVTNKRSKTNVNDEALYSTENGTDKENSNGIKKIIL